jgi:hypothetical protein
MFVAWALFPLVLLAVCLGCGLAVERVAGWRLPGALLASVGLALVIVTATVLTHKGSTARFTTAAVVVLAVAGYLSSLRRLRELRPEPWALAVGLGVYAVLAAPIVLSGNSTFLGYFVLNDSAVHFALVDQLLSHGPDLRGLRLSALSVVLHAYLANSYPVGSQVALGAVRPLVAQNVAWVFQPYLAVILSLGAVTLYQLLDGVVRSRPLRALCAFVAAQPGLIYAFYLEASIKELTTSWVITLTVAVVLVTLRGKPGPRRVVPLAIVAVAGFDVLNLAIVPWLGIPLAAFVMIASWRARAVIRGVSKRRLALATGAFGAALAVAAAPIIVSAHTFFNVTKGTLTNQGDLGNLVMPLSRWQLFGIWPSGDFRFPVIYESRLAFALIGIAVASAILGAVWAVRVRAAGPLLLLGGSGLAAIYLMRIGSPYANAKVMVIFSLTVMLIVMLGAVALHDSGWRVEGWGLAAALAGGVLWTNVVAYEGASVAPRAQFAELAAIGSRFAGQGPTFFNLSDEFGIHFLGPEAPIDTAFTPPTPRPGLPPRALQELRAPWDPDELSERFIQSFSLLVLGRSPRSSRPPADYRLAYRGRYFDVWRRSATPQVLQHVPLGSGLDPAAVPRCDVVDALARRALREQARLAAVVRVPVPMLVPTQARRPPNWGLVDGDPYSLIPRQEAGAATGAVRVQTSGRYEVWLQGTYSRQIQVWIDGRHVGSESYQLGPRGQTEAVGTLDLRAGSHEASIVVPNTGSAPGGELVNQTFGPLMLASSSESEAVKEVDPAQARSLCGQSLDWIEIVR